MLAAAAAARGASDAAARRAAADSVAAHADALPSPPAAAHADAPTASLGLGDWMNLAYTVSTSAHAVAHPLARSLDVDGGPD